MQKCYNMCKAFNTVCGAQSMTAVIVMIISTLLFSCSCQVKQTPGDFSRWNLPTQNAEKSGFLCSLAYTTSVVYKLQDSWQKDNLQVFLGLTYQILEVITTSIFVCWTQLTRTVCPNQHKALWTPALLGMLAVCGDNCKGNKAALWCTTMWKTPCSGYD